MFWRKSRVASKAASPLQEQPDHSTAAPHLGFGVLVSLIIYCFHFPNHSPFCPCPVVTWSSKDSRSSMSLFSLSGREKGEFSTGWSGGAWGARLGHEPDPFRLVTTEGGVRARTTGHEAQARLGGGCSQGSYGILTQHACPASSSSQLHAKRLIFYVRLACKNSRVKHNCNTKSHRSWEFNTMTIL